MIDGRQLSSNFWLQREFAEVAKGQASSSAPWFLEARTALASYLAEVFSHLPEWDVTGSELPQVIAAHPPGALRSSGIQPAWPPEVMTEVEASLSRAQGDELAASDWLIGSALFYVLCDEAQRSRGTIVGRLLSWSSTRLHSFAMDLGAAGPQQLAAVVAGLRFFVEDECTHPERYFGRERLEALRHAGVQWAGESELVSVWETRAWLGFMDNPVHLSVLTALAAVKPHEVLPLLEAINPLPLQRAALSCQSVWCDFDKARFLLEMAPSVVDPQSGKWNGKTLAPLMLNEAMRSYQDLATVRGSSPPAQASVAEIKEEARKLAVAVLKRTDGPLMISNWTQFLVHRAAFESNDEAFGAVFDASLAVLASSEVDTRDLIAGLPVGSQAALLPEDLTYEGVNRAYERLLLACMLWKERFDGAATSRQPGLREALVSMMRVNRRPFQIGYREVMPTWRHKVVSDLYLAEPDPASAWRQDFNALSAQRRAAVHFLYSDDSSLMGPSHFLAGVGLSLVDSCVQSNSEPLRRAALSVHRVVEEASRLYYTHRTLSSEHWQRVASSLFALFPACLKFAPQAEENSREAARLLDRLGQDELLVSIAIANLLHNGVTPLEICGQNSEKLTSLMMRMRQYVSWEGAAGSRTPPPAIVKYLTTRFIIEPAVPGAKQNESA